MSDPYEYESEFTRFYDMLGEEQRRAEALTQQQPPPAPAMKEEQPQESEFMKFYLSLADDKTPAVVKADSLSNNPEEAASNVQGAASDGEGGGIDEDELAHLEGNGKETQSAE